MVVRQDVEFPSCLADYVYILFAKDVDLFFFLRLFFYSTFRTALCFRPYFVHSPLARESPKPLWFVFRRNLFWPRPSWQLFDHHSLLSDSVLPA